jgi:hypothetical protein
MGVQKEASHKYGAKLWTKSVVTYLWAADSSYCKAFANTPAVKDKVIPVQTLKVTGG